MTIEDPVEYELEGIGQTRVNAKVEMTFARGLRAILRRGSGRSVGGRNPRWRNRPDRRSGLADRALVLSTLHTNSALGAISRLQDMGVEPFLLSTSLLAVMSQRLVRQLCPHCRQPSAGGCQHRPADGGPGRRAAVAAQRLSGV